ncbi:hypothetical protein [Algoriphagus litoralis]|uniref:hypothetical protein n=1 Tax=Algoriphagus litoralis TaxID=2202829 RepID=UPI000DBA4F76|nr:hypothetical protein [Algoriphagus litoralis]
MKLLAFLHFIFLHTDYLNVGLPTGITGKFETQSTIPKNTSIEPELVTEGLYFAEFYEYIYRGHFEEVRISREDQVLMMILSKYLRTYGVNCSAFLPENTVEILDWYCAKEEISSQNGLETSRVCIDYDQKGSGIFADPDLYDALLQLENKQSAALLQTALRMITDPDSIENSPDLFHKAKGLVDDMAIFFNLNPCNSAAIRRFESNLKNYTLQLAPDKLDAINN